MMLGQNQQSRKCLLYARSMYTILCLGMFWRIPIEVKRIVIKISCYLTMVLKISHIDSKCQSVATCNEFGTNLLKKNPDH